MEHYRNMTQNARTLGRYPLLFESWLGRPYLRQAAAGLQDRPTLAFRTFPRLAR